VDDAGKQLNSSSVHYHVPTAYDIPIEFNVSLLEGTPSPAGISGSKSSSEAPLCLVNSVYLAVKEAIYAGRMEAGRGGGWFMLDVPLTPERLRQAVGAEPEAMVVP